MYCRTLRYTHEYQKLHFANFEVMRADGFSQSQAQWRVLHILNTTVMRLFEKQALTKMATPSALCWGMDRPYPPGY